MQLYTSKEVAYVRVCKPKNRYLQICCKLLLCVGVALIKKTLEWQLILPIPSSETTIKYLKIELFMVAVFATLFI